MSHGRRGHLRDGSGEGVFGGDGYALHQLPSGQEGLPARAETIDLAAAGHGKVVALVSGSFPRPKLSYLGVVRLDADGSRACFPSAVKWG